MSAPLEFPYYQSATGGVDSAQFMTLSDKTYQQNGDKQTKDREDPENYYIPEDSLLIHAIDMAILLNRPLLLTGEPGTGKTQLAYHIAWKFGLGEPLRFDTKSTSTAQDLFYTYDTLRHFHDAQLAAKGEGRGAPNASQYITYQALGRAILYAMDEIPEELYSEEEGLDKFLERIKYPKKKNEKERHKMVMLVDEIDKAPRDFSNDILNEIENFSFTIPLLSNQKIAADRQYRPILVFTSNDEKILPDAFLRRCAYYHLPFPDEKTLQQIVSGRIPNLQGKFISEALALFEHIRKRKDLNKKPATAELLDWLFALREYGLHEKPLRKHSKEVAATLSLLIKEPREDFSQIVANWSKGK